tara:strand:+ start:19514 stop:20524 length:1011 start_codon:yes stop_codon:yes gene_type:complete
MKTRTDLFNNFINLLLDIFFIKKNTWKREKFFFLLSSLILVPANILRGKKRKVQDVERQYDLISGSYIKDNYYEGKDRFCIVNDQIKRISSIENMQLIRNESNTILSDLSFNSILEVGAGELTTIESIYSHNKNIKIMYGIDLSLNRMLHGLEEFKKRHPITPTVSKSNAMALPFQDSSFNLVYSRHALEQMQGIFRIALSEMIRVSNRYIVLFEPSYEKGSFTQKLKMRRNDYFIGLDRFLKTREDLIIVDSFLMKNSANPLNRTACYILEKNDSAQQTKEFRGFVCPINKDILEPRDGYLFSVKSNLSYPIIAGVPILDSSYSFYIDYQNKDIN